MAGCQEAPGAPKKNSKAFHAGLKACDNGNLQALRGLAFGNPANLAFVDELETVGQAARMGEFVGSLLPQACYVIAIEYLEKKKTESMAVPPPPQLTM